MKHILKHLAIKVTEEELKKVLADPHLGWLIKKYNQPSGAGLDLKTGEFVFLTSENKQTSRKG